mgnify:CR=1 FL=1
MTPLDWFKKERPLIGLLGSGGGLAQGAALADPVTVRYVLVGGGGAGGGGQGGGGGGGAGVRTATLEVAGGTAHPYQVGDGGRGYHPSYAPTTPQGGQGQNGTTSWFTDPTITAGGGGGGGWQQVGPPGTADHGADGSPFGGGGGGGGQDGPWETVSPYGSGGATHPEVNSNASYNGGNGYGGPGGGGGNRGGGGGGAGQHAQDADHSGPSAGGPTQNTGAAMVGGNGGLGYQVPTTYIPDDARNAMIPASTANSADQLFVYYPGVAYDVPTPANFLGFPVPNVPGSQLRYFGGGGGGGAETTRGGFGSGAPTFPSTGNYGGGGPAAGGGTNDPSAGANGVPGINARGGGGGGAGPGGNIAPGKNPASTPGSWPNSGHPGGSGVLIVQYPDAYTLTRSQPTYTSDISGPGPEGYKYFVAMGPAGASKGYNWPHPGTGTVQWDA